MIEYRELMELEDEAVMRFLRKTRNRKIRWALEFLGLAIACAVIIACL